jgi:hypothetical protein
MPTRPSRQPGRVEARGPDEQFQALAGYATLIIHAGGVADARKTSGLPSHRRLASAALSAARLRDPLELVI